MRALEGTSVARLVEATGSSMESSRSAPALDHEMQMQMQVWLETSRLGPDTEKVVCCYRPTTHKMAVMTCGARWLR
jgi:hypothetical protein